MRLYPAFPSDTLLHKWHHAFSKAEHSYREVGHSKGAFPAGYDHDYNEVYLGEGEACFEKAKEAVRNWYMFPESWTRIYPWEAPIKEGQVVMVLFRLFGFWWANACQIIYMVETENRYGFGYGTLKGHVEKGEEYFGVRMEADGRVYYEVRAFSRPAVWLTRLTYPLPRLFQRRFVRHSKARMQRMVAERSSSSPAQSSLE
ncbi:MAG: DUF1990 domain-containing protein [Saprospiraceae bacterium]|nr:DUF1990 domain-containing protein [Saprospiraceae bacterium]